MDEHWWKDGLPTEEQMGNWCVVMAKRLRTMMRHVVQGSRRGGTEWYHAIGLGGSLAEPGATSDQPVIDLEEGVAAMAKRRQPRPRKGHVQV
eukprot:5295332-Amphidinium_carterae.1